MKNYIDFDWTPDTEYRVFSFRRLAIDLYKISELNVAPIDVRQYASSIREVSNGSVVATFRSFESYYNCFMYFHSRDYGVVVPEGIYNKLFKQYLSLVHRTKNKTEKIYATPGSNKYYHSSLGNVMEINVYYINGTYTVALAELNKFPYNATNQEICDEWLKQQDDSWNFCKENTEILNSIVEHLKDVATPRDVQERYFNNVIELNKNKGYDMCAYRVKYLDTNEITCTYARVPSDITTGLREDFKSRVSEIKTIGYANSDLVIGKPYRIYFTDNTVINFVYNSPRDLARLTGRYVKLGRPFRVGE